MPDLQRTVNIYREPQLKEDDVSVKRGFLSTVLYAVTLLIAFVIIAVFLFQQERTYQVKLTNPTLQEVLNVEASNPVCQCAKTLIQVKDVASLSTFLADQSTPECSPATQGTCSLIADVYMEANLTAAAAATVEDSELRQFIGVWTQDVLGSADGYCFTISNSVSRIKSSTDATAIGASTLLSRTQFQDSVLGTMRVALIDLSNAYSSTDTVRRARSRPQYPRSSRSHRRLALSRRAEPSHCCSGRQHHAVLSESRHRRPGGSQREEPSRLYMRRHQQHAVVHLQAHRWRRQIRGRVQPRLRRPRPQPGLPQRRPL